MSDLFTAESIISLLTLTFLEIVLGIDNIIFISIAANKLAAQDQAKARVDLDRGQARRLPGRNQDGAAHE